MVSLHLQGLKFRGSQLPPILNLAVYGEHPQPVSCVGQCSNFKFSCSSPTYAAILLIAFITSFELIIVETLHVHKALGL